MAPVPVASIFSSTESQKEIKHTVFFFQGSYSQFSTSVLDAQVERAACTQWPFFHTSQLEQQRCSEQLPRQWWMGIISRHNSNIANVANPHLPVGTVPKMNSETTDLKSDHLILIPPRAFMDCLSTGRQTPNYSRTEHQVFSVHKTF